MEAAPKPAHVALADAVDRLFRIMASEAPMQQSIDDAMGQIELARRNYRLAASVAGDMNFGAVVAKALAFLDAGNADGVRACLNALNLAADYVPLVDLSSITAPGGTADVG